MRRHAHTSIWAALSGCVITIAKSGWSTDYANTLQVVYGLAPCVDAYGGVAWFGLLMVGLEPGGVACATTWRPSVGAVPDPVADDYPFPYLRTRSIPPLYLAVLGLILLASFVLILAAAGPLGQMRSYLDLFFMGAAFLLLETKNVVQFALLFGTTWFVNALVFFGILLSVIAAVEVARRTRLRQPNLLYLALFGSLVLAWAIPPELVLSLDVPARLAAAARSRSHRSFWRTSSSRSGSAK